MIHFYPWFRLDSLNGFIVIFIALFSILTLIYSKEFMRPVRNTNQINTKTIVSNGVKGKSGLIQYYIYIILTALASIGAVLSNNLILLLIFWGFLGLTLYLLINLGENNANLVAKKTFIIVGGADVLMLLGIVIISYLTNNLEMDKIKISLNLSGDPLPTVAYLCIAIGCFAKAGAMPMHSWIPDCAEAAPVPVVAYLPASLDKLLGIYLLARISIDLFVMNYAMNMFLMIIGAVTIIAAVMMALIQHNMKRLLGYHAVSQVGYMVLGIGTGNPIGIAGGIFHMLNHAIYKSCLFLTAGNVEKNEGTTDLDKLGGLSSTMPITYISALIASLSISGVPPFNGFFSKWMVYQGLITAYQASSIKYQVFILMALVAAMFGSALTLASFMKLLHAVFLGQKSSAFAEVLSPSASADVRRSFNEGGQKPKINEVSWMMWFPCAVLAIICIIFGVFAYQIPLRYFILPAIGNITFMGTWNAVTSTLLIIIGLILGLLIFKLRALKPTIRSDSSFIGGESLDLRVSKVSGTEFYNTIKELSLLSKIYKKAEKGFFDIYEQGRKFIFSISKVFQYLHNGILPTYLVWCLLGMLGLFYALLLR